MKDTTPTKAELRDALKRLCDAVGETEHTWPSQELYKAYCAATDLIEPDEFNKRFAAAAQEKFERERELF